VKGREMRAYTQHIKMNGRAEKEMGEDRSGGNGILWPRGPCMTYFSSFINVNARCIKEVVLETR
jgi:hypothetical protein